MISNSSFNAISSTPMAAKRGRPKLGGARPGAGRKRVLKDAKPLTVTLEGPDFDAVVREADRRGVSLGTVVREAVKSHLSRRRR